MTGEILDNAGESAAELNLSGAIIDFLRAAEFAKIYHPLPPESSETKQ